MQTVSVIPKDICILTEFTLEELILMQRGLEATELNLNMNSERDREVSDFMTNRLYKYVSDLVKEISE